MEVEEFLPCPFCGYTDVRVDINHNNKMARHATATCQICGAKVSGVGVMIGEVPADDLTESAVKAWNTRTPPKESK